MRVGDAIIIRSWKGSGGAWFQHADQTRRAVITAGGITREVALLPVHPDQRAATDRTYRQKYGRGTYVDAMVTDQAATASFAVEPAD